MKKFKTLHGTPIPDVIEYIREYISTRENVEILIGSDSQSYSNRKTIYGVVVALYTKGKGAHVLCTRETLPMEYNTPSRLLGEVWKSLEVAEFLKENGLPKPTWIDIDLNPFFKIFVFKNVVNQQFIIAIFVHFLECFIPIFSRL